MFLLKNGEEMKIGILTFWWSQDNYGQLLQCYALQKYLRDLGHYAFLIRYNYNSDLKKRRNFKRIFKIFNPKKLYNYLCGLLKQRENHNYAITNTDRQFNKFREKYLFVSEKYYINYNDLKRTPPDADAYIVGSDQVWNWNYLDALHSTAYHAYFLDFGNENILRLSYAASWGASNLPTKIINPIANMLSNFNYVSVREITGKKLCKKCGIEDAEWVCDPTLLISAEQYRKIYKENQINTINKKYLLFYYLNNKCDFDIESVYNFANKKGLDVVFITGNGFYDEHEKFEATIPEWLYLVDNAEYVITNSFHCAVFSTIFYKRFGVIPLSGCATGMNERFGSLFELRGIGNRFITSDNYSALENEYIPKSVVPSARFIKVLSTKNEAYNE